MDTRQHLEHLIATERSAFKRSLYQNLLDSLPQKPVAPQFRSIEELNHALKKQREEMEAAKPKPVNTKERIQEIEVELDICRGVVPTPPGYKVDPDRVKTLMRELSQLRAKDA